MNAKHDYKVSTDGVWVDNGLIGLSIACAQSSDTAAELARRWNAEPELRAENQRLREALESVKLAADMNGNTYLLWIVTAALEAGK